MPRLRYAVAQRRRDFLAAFNRRLGRNHSSAFPSYSIGGYSAYTKAEREAVVKDLIPQEVIENKIYLMRGHKVMMSRDLAVLYGVTTKRLNEQVSEI